MSSAARLQTATAKPRQPESAHQILQRKCACGAGASGLTGECNECSKKKMVGLQTKLRVSEPGDVYEQEADRVAEQVLAKPAHLDVSGEPPRIQRYTKQATGQAGAVPASVDHVLRSPGRPLDPALRQDMEQRIGWDFSKVRVHLGGAASESARDVAARAYTMRHHIVFGVGELSPHTRDGRQLLVHELAHVVQQTSSEFSAAGILQRDVDPNAQDAWDKLSPAGKKQAQELWDHSESLLKQMGYAQMAHMSTVRTKWRDHIGLKIQVSINALDSDSKISAVRKTLQDYETGIANSLDKFFGEWEALEKRCLDEHDWLLRQRTTDATEAAKLLNDRYMEVKRWNDRGALAWITDDDYLLLKDMLDNGKHISVGVLRASRGRAKKLSEMLDIVAELRRSGEDADKYVPGWIERVKEEMDHLAGLAKGVGRTSATDYSREFTELRNDLAAKNAEARRAHKREKSILEKGVDLVSGGVEAVVGPFVETARQLVDLVSICMHFASLGQYEPRFTSDMAKAAKQGASTGDILKGMVTGLVETPGRLVKAIEDGDWEAIGREAVNVYMLAKTIRELPDLARRMPAMVAKTARALRILKARKFAVELFEARLLPKAAPKTTSPKSVPAPEPVQIVGRSAPQNQPPASAPTDVPAPSPPVQGFRGKNQTPAALRPDVPAQSPPVQGFRGKNQTPAALRPDMPAQSPPVQGFRGRNQPPATLRADVPAQSSPVRAFRGKNDPPVPVPADVPAKTHAAPVDMPPARELPSSPRKDPGATAQRRDQPAKSMADSTRDKPADVRRQPPSEKSSPAAKTAEKPTGPGPDTVPASQLRQELRNRLEARVKLAEERATEFRREAGTAENKIKAINEKIKNAATKAERDRLKTERQELIDDRVNLGTGEDFGAQVAEAKRLLRGTQKDYFDALSSAASKQAEYTTVKGRRVDEVFKRKGSLEVEHIYPRSKIFNTPGFEKVLWEDQVALFNYEPNLRLISGEINLARSNIPYGSWNRNAWSRFPEITADIISSLAKLESEMQIKIEAMIKNPSTIPRTGTKQ